MYTNVCKHCHKTFQSRIKTYSCKACKSRDENHFDEIEEYLRKYPNSNALQISEELGIMAYEVLKYQEEGRLCKVKGTFSRLEE